MASLSGLFEISTLFIICFFIFRVIILRIIDVKSNDKLPRNWPIVGMLPYLIANLHHVYDWATEILEEAGMTFLLKGPVFAKMDMLVTVDPANIHYIMSSNFSNFPKGPEFKRIFEVLGDGIFNADSELWKSLRKSTHAIISQRGFQEFFAETSRGKIERGLVPILDNAAKTKSVVDLQDLFQRLTFDTTFVMVSGFDPGCLSLDFPEIQFAKALDDAEEALFYRHVKPEVIWRLQRWFEIGGEKKMQKACDTLNRVLASYVSLKQRELQELRVSNTETADLLTSYFLMKNQEDIKTNGLILNSNSDKFLRDTMLNLLLAGRDTTSSALAWFFWLISKNQETITKIRKEIDSELPNLQNWSFFNTQEMNKLVYLQGALREALRLYPPVPFQHKSPLKFDTLPSGHHVDEDTKILFPLYALGRMRSVWGEDAEDFKPERWISEQGRIRHEPAYKFMVFNAGPRTCLGKGVAFAQMMAVVITIMQNYDVEVVEGAKVEPCLSVILHMKHGLKVRITKRTE